jgi:hypothetical protein
MNWAELNAHEDVERDRIFCVTMRPSQDGEQRSVTVKLEACEVFDMSRHGPLMPQLRAAAINSARQFLDFQHRREKVFPIRGFQWGWWGDAIIEVAQ